MEAIVQHSIGTTQEWMSANPLLYEAVWAIEIEPSGRRLLKIGDGEHYWQALPYVDENYIKGLPEKLAELARQVGSLAGAAQALQEALAQEAAARAQGDSALQGSISAQVQNEAALRSQADDGLRLSMEAQLQSERTARESLQMLLGHLLEFVREQLGPFEPVKYITHNGLNLVTHDEKYLVTQFDINQII
jgi:hypothetical protein